VRPTRKSIGSWLDGIPNERRTALGALVLLLLLLFSLVMYERFTEGRQMAPQDGQTAPEATAPDGPPGSEAQGQGAAPGGEVSAVNPPLVEAPQRPTELLRPLVGTPSVLREFGHAFSLTYNDFRLHPGIDFAARIGQEVKSAATGTVSSIEQDPADGRVIRVVHAGGLETLYAGLGSVRVTEGATVEVGQILGEVGEPGPARVALGTHLHFGLLDGGAPIDPAGFFRQ
jgi:murein DD-endopeptidase MepM/ murein hydrolase activator NlpD